MTEHESLRDENSDSIYRDPQWDVPGWDWHPDDSTWLSSRSGIHLNGVSIFFIHGGRIRHQAHVPHDDYRPDQLAALIGKLSEGLDDPVVRWWGDTGDGDADLWVEGTRAPNADDLERLEAARQRQRRDDELSVRFLRGRRPDLFAPTDTP